MADGEFASKLDAAKPEAPAAKRKAKDQTKTEGGDLKQVTYLGCLGPGAETRTYVLNKVVPVTRTTETSTPAGSASTRTPPSRPSTRPTPSWRQRAAAYG